MKSLFVLLILSLPALRGVSQPCAPDTFQFVPTTLPGTIDWNKFPEFSLPPQFDLVYGGPRLGDRLRLPLRHGFTHLSTFVMPYDGDSLPRPNRAILWTGVAGNLTNSYTRNQPWATIVSPWNNTLADYQHYWQGYMTAYANLFTDTQGDSLPSVDLLCADIEKHLDDPASILAIKDDSRIPLEYQLLPDEQFVLAYKKAMIPLYNACFDYVIHRGLDPTIRLTSYADAPVRRTWWDITTRLWHSWQTDPEVVHYLMKDTTLAYGSGPLYNSLNLLAPSSYYFYDYPNAAAPDYLAYMLFQIEANQAWSSKDILLYQWMQFSGCCGSSGHKLQPFMAEASAIFPFLDGASGIWLYDYYPGTAADTTDLSVYEHYIHGLYRLSLHKQMFQGPYTLVNPKSGRDLMIANAPIWRGVVNGNRILIGAHNPYAQPTDLTYVPVSYFGWQDTIPLLGTEVFLGEFAMTTTGLAEVESSFGAGVAVAPNPLSTPASVHICNLPIIRSTVQFELYDVLGRRVIRRSARAEAHEVTIRLDDRRYSPGVYFYRLTSQGKTTITGRVVFSE